MLDEKLSQMRCFFFPMLPFVLPGLEIQQIVCTEMGVAIIARAMSPRACCPACQQESHRLHSYYTRSPQDLPVSGQTVRLNVQARRFRCQNRACQKQTFVESLPGVVPRYARQTKRLQATLKLFAVALSGQAGSRLLKRMVMAVSGDTLLRLANRSEAPGVKAPQILGVDDFTDPSGPHLRHDPGRVR
jgi:transposase